MRRIIADAILITSGALLLGLFTLFWFYGWITVGEPNLVIRTVETFMCIGIVTLGLSCLFEDYRSLGKK